jgi:beta-lactam-binding protein with PASTA domain
VDKIKNANERKKELNQWFGTVLATMERDVLGKGVPNLQKLDLFTAAERAREFGMKVVPVGEDPSYPNIAPGLIVSQNPMPGTLVQVESKDPEQRPQIHVVLSRRP